MEKDYNKQAEDFLVSCKVEYKAEKAVPQTAPRWSKDGRHGTQWSITLTKYENQNRADEDIARVKFFYHKPLKTIQFFFWSSIKSKEDTEHRYQGEKKPEAYDVLAGLYIPVDSFEDFCANFGYSEDSREAEATFKEVQELNKKLESIFTSEELERLSEIQ